MATLGRPPPGQYPPRIQRLLESMQTAQDRILKLQEQLNTAKSEYGSLKLEWDEYQASIAPIRNCPNEILSTVFHFYLLENPRIVRRLLLVCKQWYAIVVGDPRMWNHISITIPDKWHTEYVASSIQRCIERCVERSGMLPLDLHLDLGNLRSAADQIIEHIRACFDDTAPGWDAIYDWSDDLDVVDLLESPIAKAFHPELIFKAIQKLIGDRGEIMERWGAVKLTFSESNIPLVVEMWQIFAWPTPNLTSMVICWDDDIEDYLDELTSGFPRLPSLKHLDVDAVESLEFLNLENSSLESLVIYCSAQSWSALGLSRFTQLQRLEFNGLNSNDEPVERLVLSLPNLQHLVLRWSVKHLDKVDFQVPVLNSVELIRSKHAFAYDHALPLPKLQTLHVRWILLGGESVVVPQDTLTSELKSILAQFNTAVSLTINEVVRNSLVEIIPSLRVDGQFPSALETVTVIKAGGGEEALLVSSLR